MSLECEVYRNKATCKAKVKVHIQRNEIVDALHDHTHAPDETKIEAAKTIHNIKMKAINTEETAQQIISEACALADEATGANKLPICHLKHNIRCQQQRSSHLWPLPLNTQELVLTDEHIRTQDSQDFLLYDSGPVDKRILIFGSPPPPPPEKKKTGLFM